MEFKSNVNPDCCTPTGKYEICGCSNGVAYVQLTVVGGGTVQTAWLNTETGDTFTTKPEGFVTGTCSDAAAADVLKFSATAPTASAPFTSPKDGYTTIVTSDGTETGDVTGLFLYEATTGTWKEIPVALPDVVTTFEPEFTEGLLIGTYTNEEGTAVEVFIPEPVALIQDNQVLTGDENTNVALTFTPSSEFPEDPDSEQVNYLISASVRIDGVTIVEDPTTKVLSAVIFKELNRFYVDPNGLDANTGANEAPFLTIQAAIDAAAQGDIVVVNEGVYAETATISVQNQTLAGASGAYGSLTQIASVVVSTASGTSNRISDLTITGTLERTGNAPLYLNNVTVSGNTTIAGTAYVEIRDSSLQDGTITLSAASTLFVEDSKLGANTFSTAGSVVSLRNVTIDAGDCVTIGAGVVYSLQDVVGCVNIDAAAVNAEVAAVAGGLTAAQAEAAVTANFMHIRMHNADQELAPTQVVTRDPVTGELEFSPLSAIATAAPVHASEVQLATAAQDEFTLDDTPIGAVIVTRNGVDISDSFTWVGAVGTYDPAENLDCTFDADDKIRFHYETAA